MERHNEFVLRALDEHNLRFVRLWFTDVLGYLKSVAIAPAELETAFDEGVIFDGSSINSAARVSESDSFAVPDASTFAILPWKSGYGHFHTARMFCDIKDADNSPSWADSRNVLRRQVHAAAEKGLICYTHPEIEFYLFSDLFDDGNVPIPADDGGFFDQTVHEKAPDFRRQTIDALETMGIPVEFSHHESGPGQQEIDLRFSDILSMADNIMTARYLIKMVAMQEGAYASFMPKPITELPGSAMHCHFSLFRGEDNEFFDPDDRYFMSTTAKHFIAGILAHAGELSAITNQWFNSYRRLAQGSEAPTVANWGFNNRSALIRVPTIHSTRSVSCRVEVRSPDSGCNPYLALSVLLAAGLKGIEEKYEFYPPSQEDAGKMTRAEKIAHNLVELPMSLPEALHKMEKSELVAHALGEEVFEYFLRNKWEECADFHKDVTYLERKKYIRL